MARAISECEEEEEYELSEASKSSVDTGESKNSGKALNLKIPRKAKLMKAESVGTPELM